MFQKCKNAYKSNPSLFVINCKKNKKLRKQILEYDAISILMQSTNCYTFKNILTA